MPWVITGGYLGVDIFFVISGFLITSILWRDLDGDRFSFAKFYAKRIRRLFPALFAVLLTGAVTELLIGLPDEVYAFGLSAISSAFYVSNHYFLSQNDYFDDSLELNPLLHTWSLSVEEQFYIIFPALLFLIYRKQRGKAFAILAVVAGASLLLSEVLLHFSRAASFFIAPSRFWQFLIGALLALRPLKKPIRAVPMEFLAFGGLAILLYCFFSYSDTTLFPGINAILPTIATAMVIFAGQQKNLLASRLLSISPARFLGKISYSLYLWHWPIIVFYKIEFEPDPSSTDRYLLILLSLLAGYLSWRFIENPFRHLRIQPSEKRTLAMGVCATILIALVGIGLVTNDGGRRRYSSEKLNYINLLNYDASPYYRTDSCFLTSQSELADSHIFDEQKCITFKTNQPNVLIVGDSHAAQYYYALKESLPSISFSQANASGCRPLTNYVGEKRCTDLMRLVFEVYVQKYPFDAIILAGRWEDSDLTSIAETVSQISNETDRVIVLGPIIEYKQALPRLLARHDPSDEALDAARLYSDTKEMDTQLYRMLHGLDVEYYSIVDAICPQGKCKLFSSDGMPIQFDASHLTHEGALETISSLIESGLLSEE